LAASAPNVVTVVGAGAAGAAVAHDDQSAAAHATPARKAGRLSPVPMPSASAAADPQESPGRDGDGEESVTCGASVLGNSSAVLLFLEIQPLLLISF